RGPHASLRPAKVPAMDISAHPIATARHEERSSHPARRTPAQLRQAPGSHARSASTLVSPLAARYPRPQPATAAPPAAPCPSLSGSSAWIRLSALLRITQPKPVLLIRKADRHQQRSQPQQAYDAVTLAQVAHV